MKKLIFFIRSTFMYITFGYSPKLTKLYDLGMDKFYRQEYEVSIVYMDKAIEMNPKFIPAYIGRGIAKRNLNDNKGAIDDYSKALEINPKSSEAYYNRGIVKIIIEDYLDAINDYSNALNINKRLVGAYYGRGLAKGKLNDNIGAISDFNIAIDINPRYAEAYFNRGLAKISAGYKDSAYYDLLNAENLGFIEATKILKEYY